MIWKSYDPCGVGSLSAVYRFADGIWVTKALANRRWCAEAWLDVAGRIHIAESRSRSRARPGVALLDEN